MGEGVAYAWWTDLPPDPASMVPYTGWVHEQQFPWRVIVFDTAIESERFRPDGFRSIEFDGVQDTVHWTEVWPHLVNFWREG